jgi:hypothetical protein
VEQQLTAGLRERQVAEFVEDDEMDASEAVGDAALTADLDLGLELVDEVDNVEEAGLAAGSDAAASDGYGDVALARAGAADEDDVALAVEERTTGKVVHELFVDRRALEGNVGELLGQRQLALPIW